MGIISWVIFGVLAGWLASIIAGRGQRQGCLVNIVVGVVGAFIGGALYEFLTGREFGIGFNLPSFAVAVLGAVVLLIIARLIGGRR